MSDTPSNKRLFDIRANARGPITTVKVPPGAQDSALNKLRSLNTWRGAIPSGFTNPDGYVVWELREGHDIPDHEDIDLLQSTLNPNWKCRFCAEAKRLSDK